MPLRSSALGAEQTFQSKEDFFRFLEQEAELEPVSDLTLTRVAQLTQKTNQFNLTTRRYTEPQIAEMAKQPEWHLFSIECAIASATTDWSGSQSRTM